MNRSKGLAIAVLSVFMFGVLVSFAMAADKTKIPAPQATTPGAANAMLPKAMIQKKPVVVEVKDMLVVLGAENAKVVTTVKSLDGVPVSKGQMKFKINGVPTDVLMAGFPSEMKLEDSGSGGSIQWSIPAYLDSYYKPLHMGSNTIEAVFTGNDEYAQGSGKGNLAIMKAATKMDISVFCTSPCISGAPENRRKMVGGLTRLTDGEALDGRAVIITLDGKKIGTVPTSKGHFEITHDFTDAERGKSLKLKAVFEGDDLHLATGAERDMTIAPAPPVPVDVYYAFKSIPPGATFGQTVQIEAMLSRSTKAPGQAPVAPYANKKVYLDLNKSYLASATTDAMGKATFKFVINRETSGKLSLAGDEPDKFHAAVTGQGLVVLPGISSMSMISAPSSAAIGGKIKVKVKLTALNKPVSGRYLSISLAGQAGSPSSTGPDGVAELSIDITSAMGLGQKKIIVTFAPDPKYDSLVPSKAEHNINITPKTN